MRLSEINVYPVKSLKGVGLPESMVEDRGLRFDRRWMLVDDAGNFMTQREFPVMATIAVEVADGVLRASVNGVSIEVPFLDGADEHARVKVWSSSVKAGVYSDRINDWFSDAIRTPCKVVGMTSQSKRAVNPFYAVRKFRDQVSFADGYPFLLIGQSSLDDLNSRLSEPVPMNRFRPSFVVEGAEPFAEDGWKKIRIGSTVFHLVKPCARCVMTTIDQVAGVKTGPDPLKTLASYRNRKGKVLFGQNLIAESAGDVVRVGDEVEIIEQS
jgi:uncharacterized protein YcbX